MDTKHIDKIKTLGTDAVQRTNGFLDGDRARSVGAVLDSLGSSLGSLGSDRGILVLVRSLELEQRRAAVSRHASGQREVARLVGSLGHD